MTQQIASKKATLSLCLLFVAVTNCGIGFELSKVQAKNKQTSSTGFFHPWIPEQTTVHIRHDLISQLEGGPCAPGTGGSIICAFSELSSTKQASTDTVTAVVMKTNAEQIAAIRSSLSLNITELASVLNVERPTVYSWIQGRSEPHPVNRERLLLLYRFAKSWSRQNSQPMGTLRNLKGEEGQSLVDMLRQPDLDEAALTRTLESLLEAKNQETQKDQLALAATSARRARIISRAKGDSTELDVFTGKRTMLD